MSFRKFAAGQQSAALPAQGTRISGATGKPTVSFGAAALDGSIGAQPLGSVWLVLGDRGSGYAPLLLTYGASQAAACGHTLALVGAAPDAAAAALFRRVADDEAPADDESLDADDDDAPPVRQLGALRAGAAPKLAIAWRYQNMAPVGKPSSSSSSSLANSNTPFCSVFDITKTIDKQSLEAASIATINVSHWTDTENATAAQVYDKLYESILSIVNQGRFRNSDPPLSATQPPTVLRIVIDDLAGPSWGTDAGSTDAFHALVAFLLRLKLLLRDCRAVLVMSMRSWLFKSVEEKDLVLVNGAPSLNPYVVSVLHACDGVLEVESFSGEDVPP
ncbi:Elongator complex protein 4 [Obelidium mucronatum]|nr:Elongator complex protein 4 [Obelidium mucronatum]